MSRTEDSKDLEQQLKPHVTELVKGAKSLTGLNTLTLRFPRW
ncbi:hypothetical protein SAMN05660479_01278 [Microbulbifer thermotolerans]|nr:hypothetical protein SAMN05660479_01278 [Microbulbifer thermotolerans]